MANSPEKVTSVVHRLENEYVRGSTQLSKYVSFSMYDTINRIEAYLNSKHISGENDSQGRPKPFFNISVAAANVWMRATDLDRRNIRLYSKNRKEWINSFFANIVLQDWMKRENFGQFLNDWGRVLARYGSALLEFVENSSGLHVNVLPWNRIIVDPIAIGPNPKIKVLEITESQLRESVEENGYDEDQVNKLIAAKTARETIDKRRKDNRLDYYKLYEVHGKFSRELRTGKPSDANIFEHQMWVISFVGGTTKDKDEEEFVLFSGKESGDLYMETHLIKEDGRSLAIGAVEYLFDAQWMQNHVAKSIKDQLDIASKLVMQTSDPNFVGRNILTQLEQGDILVTLPNMPLTQVANFSHDTTALSNYAIAWRDVGREITNISEAMLGQAPKSGTAWHQTEAILSESYSLFELMTENKGLYIEQMLRERILPYLFKKYDNADEISALLEKHDIEKLDSMYIKGEAIRRANAAILDRVLQGEVVSPEEQSGMIEQNQQELQDQIGQLGNQRFFKPSEISWKKQFEGIEWDIEIDVTGEDESIQEALTTLNTALKLVLTPGFDQNPKAQAIVGRILDMTGTMAAAEYNALPVAAAPATGGSPAANFQLPSNDKNINVGKK